MGMIVSTDGHSVTQTVMTNWYIVQAVNLGGEVYALGHDDAEIWDGEEIYLLTTRSASDLVPEPLSMAVLGGGVLGLVLRRRQRQR